MDSTTAILIAISLYLLNTFKPYLEQLAILLYSTFVSSLSVNSSQSEYSVISKYVYHLYAHHRLLKVDKYRLSIFAYSCDVWTLTGEDTKNDAQVQLDEGIFFLRHPLYGLMQVQVKLLGSPQNGGVDWVSRSNFGEPCTLSVHFLSKNVIPTFLHDALQYVENNQPNHYLRAWSNQALSYLKFPANLGRSWDSIILPEAQKARILNDVRGFFSNEDIYQKLGIPYRRGLLLSGEPGTGKTTVVRGLQQELRIPLYVLNLSRLDDDSLIQALTEISTKKSLVLFEDIDVCTDVLHKRDQDKESTKLTLAGFLNAIDGVQSPTGTYFIFTTNRPDVLDEAVVRTGRIDVKETLDYLDAELVKQFVLRFFGSDMPNLDSDLKLSNKLKASDIQAECLKNVWNKLTS